jgi:hypothetical protein
MPEKVMVTPKRAMNKWELGWDHLIGGQRVGIVHKAKQLRAMDHATWNVSYLHSISFLVIISFSKLILLKIRVRNVKF